jgi:diadenosine tetraphosphate (Ap4A) HIT family hydrolase
VEIPEFGTIDDDQVVASSTHGVAFYDAYPIAEGHTLVVPRQPGASIYDLPEQQQTDLWDLVRTARAVLAERLRPDGFNNGINDGCAAGQTVMQAHIHVIPRRQGDVPDPRGGVRWVLPERARYWDQR